MAPDAAAAREASLNRVFREDLELLDRLLSYVDPVDLACLSQVDRTIGAEIRAYYRRAFGVDRLLAPFFLDCNGFREMQSRTGTLISGSAAVQLFDRALYRNADLDLYVAVSEALHVVQFLHEHEGYSFVPTPAQVRTPEEAMAQGSHDETYEFGDDAGISKVLTFVRGDRRVQTIVAKSAPLEVILNFHSTCVMNIISHNAAYSLFPRLTFYDRLSCVFRASPSFHDATWAAIQSKYVERGFSFTPTATGGSGQCSVVRWVGDSRTWTIHFAGTTPIIKTPDTAALNAFHLHQNQDLEISIDFDVLREPTLRTNYTTARPERNMLCIAWENQVSARAFAEDHETLLDGPLCDVMVAYRLGGADCDFFDATLTQDSVSTMLMFLPGGRSRPTCLYLSSTSHA